MDIIVIFWRGSTEIGIAGGDLSRKAKEQAVLNSCDFTWQAVTKTEKSSKKGGVKMRRKDKKKLAIHLRNQSRLMGARGYALKAICRKASNILIDSTQPQDMD